VSNIELMVFIIVIMMIDQKNIGIYPASFFLIGLLLSWVCYHSQKKVLDMTRSDSAGFNYLIDNGRVDILLRKEKFFDLVSLLCFCVGLIWLIFDCIHNMIKA
jgi:hypothetical protein